MKGDALESSNPNPVVIQEGKTMAIIAYLTIIGLIIAFVMNNRKRNVYASFHIAQMLGLVLSASILALTYFIPVLGWIIFIIGFILLFVLWTIGFMNAANNKEREVPVFGKYYKKWLQHQ